MGRDRHYYNAKGEYRGFSSDEPPREPKDWGSILAWACYLLFLYSLPATTFVGILLFTALYWLAVFLVRRLLGKISSLIRGQKPGNTSVPPGRSSLMHKAAYTTDFSTQCRSCRRYVAPVFVGQNGRAKYFCPCGRMWNLTKRPSS